MRYLVPSIVALVLISCANDVPPTPASTPGVGFVIADTLPQDSIPTDSSASKKADDEVIDRDGTEGLLFPR